MKNQQKTKQQKGTNRNPQSRTEKTNPQQKEQQQQNEPQDQQRQQQEQQQQNEPQDQQRQQQEQQQQNEPQEETETTRPVTQNKGAEQTQAVTTRKDKPSPDGPKEQKDPLQEPTTKNKNQDGGDAEKIVDPDPTIPEKRNDPVAGKNSDYSRTMNTPGKKESGSKGEFTDTDEIDQQENEQEEEEIDPVYDKEDQEEPGSFDQESDQKEAFGGEKKNTPDATKNKNGL